MSSAMASSMKVYCMEGFANNIDSSDQCKGKVILWDSLSVRWQCHR